MQTVNCMRLLPLCDQGESDSLQVDYRQMLSIDDADLMKGYGLEVFQQRQRNTFSDQRQ